MSPESENLPEAKETLSQSKIENGAVAIGGDDESSDDASPHVSAKPFQQPPFAPEDELRKFRLQQENYARSFAAQMSVYLRLEFGAQLVGILPVSFQQFVSSLATPSHLTLFKVDPQRGICFIEFPLHLALTIIDRLLGGSAHSVETRDKLTDIEVALLDQTILTLLKEWCDQWRTMQELRPRLLAHEIDTHLLNSTPRETMLLVLSFEASVGDCSEKFRLAFPYNTIEPLIRKLNIPLREQSPDSEDRKPKQQKWNTAFDTIPVPITAEVKGLKLRAREVASLKIGDVLPIEPHWLNRIYVRFVKTPKFLGKLGKQGQQWAVQLTQNIDQ